MEPGLALNSRQSSYFSLTVTKIGCEPPCPAMCLLIVLFSLFIFTAIVDFFFGKRKDLFRYTARGSRVSGHKRTALASYRI